MFSAEKEYSLKCPGKGAFYICEATPNRFVGCCSINPCHTDDGICPDSALGPTTFATDHWKDILPQTCAAGNVTDSKMAWYTCAATNPPFMGCCGENPCGSGCPAGKLGSAKLSDDKTNAAAFLTGPSGTNSSSTSSATSSSGAGHGSGSSGGLSTGAIAGIAAAGGVAAIAIIGCLIFCFLKKRRNKAATSEQAYEPYAGQQPQNGFRESKFSSPQYTPNTATFPPNVQNPSGHYNPQPSPPFYNGQQSPQQSPGFEGMGMASYQQSPPMQQQHQQQPQQYMQQQTQPYPQQHQQHQQHQQQQQQYQDPVMAELPHSPAIVGNSHAGIPSVSVTSYSGAGRESQLSEAPGHAVGEPVVQPAVELEDNTRWLLKDNKR